LRASLAAGALFGAAELLLKAGRLLLKAACLVPIGGPAGGLGANSGHGGCFGCLGEHSPIFGLAFICCGRCLFEGTGSSSATRCLPRAVKNTRQFGFDRQLRVGQAKRHGSDKAAGAMRGTLLAQESTESM
jgi:hypothetical protein